MLAGGLFRFGGRWKGIYGSQGFCYFSLKIIEHFLHHVLFPPTGLVIFPPSTSRTSSWANSISPAETPLRQGGIWLVGWSAWSFFFSSSTSLNIVTSTGNGGGGGTISIVHYKLTSRVVLCERVNWRDISWGLARDFTVCVERHFMRSWQVQLRARGSSCSVAWCGFEPLSCVMLGALKEHQ